MKAVCIDFAFVSGPELLAHIFTLLKNNRLFREIFLSRELLFPETESLVKNHQDSRGRESDLAGAGFTHFQ